MGVSGSGVIGISGSGVTGIAGSGVTGEAERGARALKRIDSTRCQDLPAAMERTVYTQTQTQTHTHTETHRLGMNVDIFLPGVDLNPPPPVMWNSETVALRVMPRGLLRELV